MIRLIIISSVLLLTGCVGVDKASKVMRANPVELAKLCLDCFGDKTQPTIVKGDTVVVVDSIITVQKDTVQIVADCPDGSVVVVDCPPNKVVTKVVHTHSTDSVFSDTWQTKAKVVVLEDDNEKLKSEVDKLTENRDKWRKIALWVMGLVGGGVLVKFVISRIKNRLTF